MGTAAIFCLRMSVLYASIAMAGGLYMAISGDHTAAVAHAHLAIIGWFGLLSTGFVFRNFPQVGQGNIPWIIAMLLAIGLPVMVIGITFVTYDKMSMEPLAILGSLAVFLAVLMLTFRLWTIKLS